MGKKDRTVAITLEEQKDNSVDVFFGKQKFGKIITSENGIVAKLENGANIEGKSFDNVLELVISEYNLHN